MRLAVSSALFLIAAQAQAQPPAPRETRSTIRTTGQGVVSMPPDTASVDIGVLTQASAAEAAAAQNAQQTDAVLSQLRKTAGASAQIRTLNYSLGPLYRYPRDGGEPTLTGYRASNTVEVTLTDLKMVGRVIDAAAQTGANNISRIQFLLRNEQPARAQALREATAQARTAAEAIAGTLGVKIVRVVSADEAEPPGIVRPMVREMALAAGAAPTPVESGMIEIRTTVTLVVEISQ